MAEGRGDMRKAAALVAEGKSDEEVAATLGLPAAQVKRWREKNPRFQESVAIRRSDPIRAAVTDAFAEVGDELKKQSKDNGASPEPGCEEDIAPATDAGASLTVKQRTAIELIVSGKSGTQVAERIGVNRSTIARWKRDEPFARELEARQRETVADLRARMPGLLSTAIDVIDRQLREGDPGMALDVLRLAFRYSPSTLESANLIVPPRVIALDDAEHGREGAITDLAESDVPALHSSKASKANEGGA